MKQLTLYHGTTTTVKDKILNGDNFKFSNSISDWLGPGIYMYDNALNALEYNMKNYSREHRYFPNYKDFLKEYAILECKVVVDDKEILDFNEFENKHKYIYLCEKLHMLAIKDKKYIELTEKGKYVDGYFLKYILEKSEYFKEYKILTNIFIREFKHATYITKSRFAYEIKQRFYCIIDDQCIKSKEYSKDNYKHEYNIIQEIYYNEEV